MMLFSLFYLKNNVLVVYFKYSIFASKSFNFYIISARKGTKK